MKEKIAVIGAGSWGTTLGVIFAQKGIQVELHSVFEEHNRAMSKDRENRQFLPGSKFPALLSVNPGLEQVLAAKVIVLAVPVQYMSSVLQKIRQVKNSFSDKIVVSVSKGLEEKTLLRPTQLIEQNLGHVKCAALSGPTIAREVRDGVPTACVVASRSQSASVFLQKLFSTKRFRVYSHNDVAGVELGGALKNVVAIACGISDGLGFGTNTKSALVTRGLVEIARLGKAMGAKLNTFSGISGLGDLVTTCFSQHSRNRFVGEQLGRGKKIKEIIASMNMVAEGVATARSAFNLASKSGVEMPIAGEVYSVIYKAKNPEKAVQALMTRPLKKEGIS